MTNNTFLKDRRAELQLTQKEVADFVGVSEATLSRWESGNIKNMRRDKIAKLAEGPDAVFDALVTFKYADDEEVLKRLCGLR